MLGAENRPNRPSDMELGLLGRFCREKTSLNGELETATAVELEH